MNDNQLIRLKKDESYTSNRESQDTIRITTQTEFPECHQNSHPKGAQNTASPISLVCLLL